MSNFWNLLKESVIVQGLLTLGVWGVLGYLYATGKEVPQDLLIAGTTILGFWFGSKVENIKSRIGG